MSEFTHVNFAGSAPECFSNWLRRFARSTGGNTAMMFGLSAMAVLSAGGAGLDFSRTMYAKNRAASALDAAALAVAGQPDSSDGELEALAQRIFDANYGSSKFGSTGAVSMSRNGEAISLSITGNVPTTLLQVAGKDSLSYNFTNEVMAGSTGLEVAMVLDNTGSMAGSKLASLKSAAKTLVETLSGNQASPDNVKFAVVPFAQTVRVNPNTATNGGWIDEECRSSVSQLNFSGGMCAYTVLETMHSNTRWAGCVEARPGALATNDTAPSSGTPDSLFVPYFQPDEPDRGDRGAPNGATVDRDYTDNYIEDGSQHDGGGRGGRGGRGGGGSGSSGQPGSDEVTRLMDSTKYAGKNENSEVNENCTNLEPVLPLTNNTNTVKNTISDMQADGYTHIPFGAVWGWRTLSPGAPYTEGVAYDDPETRKALIIMTDGENNIPPQSTMNGSRYSAFGYLRQGRLGTTSSSSAKGELDDMLLEVCENAKDQDIIVYTIGFAINSSNVHSLLRRCASSEEKYFNSPTASSLQTAFSAIATDLSNLRLSR